MIYDAFTSQEFVDKLVEFFSLEDRKGRDKFDEKRFRMFKVSTFTRSQIIPEATRFVDWIDPHPGPSPIVTHKMT